MKLTDKIKEKQIISIEVLPPDRGQNLDSIFESIDQIISSPLDFISVTRHPPYQSYIEKDNQIIKTIRTEKPGSLGTTVALKKRYNIDVIPHILSSSSSKTELEDLLIDLNLIGIDNLFVIRGDQNFYNNRNDDKNQEYHKYASDLVKQINDMNNGLYLYKIDKNSPTSFCVGIAAYPEKHYESPNIEEDIKYLKKKIDSGSDFMITQMVFDYKVVRNFIKRVKKNDINVPIIVGIKPIINMKSLYNLPKRFFVNIPQCLIKKMQQAKSDKEEFKIGTRYMVDLIEKLLELKIDSEKAISGIHFFTMGKGNSTKEILKAVYG